MAETVYQGIMRNLKLKFNDKASKLSLKCTKVMMNILHMVAHITASTFRIVLKISDISNETIKPTIKSSITKESP